MPNYIIYTATTDDEVYECAYSLLKWLDVYNLKPPSDLGIMLYTNQPAILEAYGPFFNSFELKSLASVNHPDKFTTQHAANSFHLPTNIYPLKQIEDFSILGKSIQTNGNSKLQIDGAYFAEFRLREFDVFLKKFLKKYQEESVPNQVKLIHHIDAKKIAAGKKAYQQLPLLVRMARKILGKGWKVADYTRRRQAG